MPSQVSVYAWCVTGREPEFEDVVAAMVRLCPWMVTADVVMVRRVWAAHFGMLVDGVVDLGRMAGDLLGLWQRAEEAGDEDWRGIYGRWYGWVCEALWGGPYRWPDVSHVVGEEQAVMGERVVRE
jgi:hypothetical protein